MSQECPLCFSRVHIGADGTCPACRGDTRTAPVDGSWTAVTVCAGHSLPCCCFLCGAPTRQAKTFAFHAGQGHVPEGLVDRLAMLGAAVALFSLLAFKRRVTYRRPLPICAGCAAGRPQVVPLQVSPEQESVRIRVHRGFRAEFEKVNEGALV